MEIDSTISMHILLKGLRWEVICAFLENIVNLIKFIWENKESWPTIICIIEKWMNPDI